MDCDSPVLTRKEQLALYKKQKQQKAKGTESRPALRSSTNRQRGRKKAAPAPKGRKTRSTAAASNRVTDLAAPRARRPTEPTTAELLQKFHSATPKRFRTRPTKHAADAKHGSHSTPTESPQANVIVTPSAASHVKAAGAAAAAAAAEVAPGTPLGNLMQRVAAVRAASAVKIKPATSQQPPVPPPNFNQKAQSMSPTGPHQQAEKAANAAAKAEVGPSTPLGKLSSRLRAHKKQVERKKTRKIVSKAGASSKSAKTKAKPTAAKNTAQAQQIQLRKQLAARQMARRATTTAGLDKPVKASGRQTRTLAKGRVKGKATTTAAAKRKVKAREDVRQRNFFNAMSSRIDEAMLLAKLGRLEGARKIMEDITTSPEFPAAKTHAVYWVARAKLEEDYAKDSTAVANTFDEAAKVVSPGVERDIITESRREFDERERRRTLEVQEAPKQRTETEANASPHDAPSPNRRLSFSGGNNNHHVAQVSENVQAQTSVSASVKATTAAAVPTYVPKACSNTENSTKITANSGSATESRTGMRQQGGVFSKVSVASLCHTYESRPVVSESESRDESEKVPQRPTREPPAVPAGTVQAARSRMLAMPFARDAKERVGLSGVALPGMVANLPGQIEAGSDVVTDDGDAAAEVDDTVDVGDDAFAQYLGCDDSISDGSELMNHSLKEDDGDDVEAPVLPPSGSLTPRSLPSLRGLSSASKRNASSAQRVRALLALPERAPKGSNSASSDAESGDDDMDDILANAAAAARRLCEPSPQAQGSHVVLAEVRATPSQQKKMRVGAKVLTPCRKSSRLAQKSASKKSNREKFKEVDFGYLPNDYLAEDLS